MQIHCFIQMMWASEDFVIPGLKPIPCGNWGMTVQHLCSCLRTVDKWVNRELRCSSYQSNSRRILQVSWVEGCGAHWPYGDRFGQCFQLLLKECQHAHLGVLSFQVPFLHDLAITSTHPLAAFYKVLSYPPSLWGWYEEWSEYQKGKWCG
jgi:hypothetical protein